MPLIDLFGSRRASNAQAYASDGFDEFWRRYPRRVDKMEAARAWRSLAPPDRAAAMGALAEHVAYWDEVGRDPEHIPHAATWLRRRRFEDELPNGAAARRAREDRLRSHATGRE